MAGQGENTKTPVVPAKPEGNNVSELSSTRRHLKYGADDADEESALKAVSPKEFLLSVAERAASQPFNIQDSSVWGVLTAISTLARKLPQGANILLKSNEHAIGRLVDDPKFKIDSTAVSGHHCKIYWKPIHQNDAESPISFFLKDNSTNGTYLNWKKLTKSSPEAEISNGDIISLANAPNRDLAYTFVFREVCRPILLIEGKTEKRKAEVMCFDNKRMKGIGIGAPDGPISLDDFRTLQKSNTELRKQLEIQALEIDALKNENQTSKRILEKEILDSKERSEISLAAKIKNVENLLEEKEKEAEELRRTSLEQTQTLQDLMERLAVSNQSCKEANEIMEGQKASISELEAQLQEERNQRQEDRQTAAAELNLALKKAKEESSEEINKLINANQQRERELQEEISKVQEREKKWCLQVDSLRPKLDEAREKLVTSDNVVRQLEAAICEEKLLLTKERKRTDELGLELSKLHSDLQNEKAAREEAWAKVSALEAEMRTALRDLEGEKRELKGARERLMLRETQLRAFYSTTEEISVLLAKQQDQIKAMQKTLEDEENYNDDDGDRSRFTAEKLGTPSSEETATQEHRCEEVNGGNGEFNTEPVCGTQIIMDTEKAAVEDSVRTGDLVASELVGGWACSTAPAGDCQSADTDVRERRELSKMIGILNRENEEGGSVSDTESEGCGDSDDGKCRRGLVVSESDSGHRSGRNDAMRDDITCDDEDDDTQDDCNE